MTRRASYSSPVGLLMLATDGRAITLCDWTDTPAADPHPLLAEAVRQLDEYFAGRRREFTVPLAVSGTPFQRAVRSALSTVPYGATATYAQLAAMAGHPAAVRAAASAVATNPLIIFLPCHRIVPASGGHGNYRGGSALKALLLTHESNHR